MNTIFAYQNQTEQQRDYYLVYLRVNGCYFWFNILQIITAISMIVLLYLEMFFAVTIVEILITFMVALDLLLRYFSEGGKTFVAGWDNRVNACILLILLISISSDVVAPELTHHDGGVMAGIFLFVRYGLQVSRLCRLIIDSKKHLQISNQQQIILSQHDQEHPESTS